MYDLPEEKLYGKYAPKVSISNYFYYHGNKREVKNWLKSIGGSFSKDFTNIPFGALKYKDEKVPVGYIIRDAEGNYTFTPELDLKTNRRFT
jgi:hypothetical protein